MKIIDLTGERFGSLVVIRRDENDKNGSPRWLCRCDCGQQKIVYGSCLRYGVSKSCGCRAKDLNSEKHRTHGLSKHPLHDVWRSMKDRCFNPNCRAYKHYGGRGITVCDEWSDFLPFYYWAIENGYQSGLSIDRIDVNGDYCPENCRWATIIEQTNNQRNNHCITYNGETHTIAEWGRITGIKKCTLYNRARRGLPPEKILTPLLSHAS